VVRFVTHRWQRPNVSTAAVVTRFARTCVSPQRLRATQNHLRVVGGSRSGSLVRVLWLIKGVMSFKCRGERGHDVGTAIRCAHHFCRPQRFKVGKNGRVY